ncbi:MAG: ferrous iron transport protein B [Bacilli bacterium]
MKRIALAGNPNSGKTTLFNSLTGSTAYVGNWPGVTVEKKEGKYKKEKELISIIDLPGIYSLSPYTPEEVISRNYILDEKPDCVINIVDATNLERNLYLTTQLMEIDVPIVIALNMMDVMKKKGDKINAVELEKRFGIPVVEISALKEENLDHLMKVAYQASLNKRVGTTVLEDKKLLEIITQCKEDLSEIKAESPLYHAIKIVEGDEIETADHPKMVKVVSEFKKTFKNDIFETDFEAIIADGRYKYITKNFAPLVSKKEKPARDKMTGSDKIDKVMTSRWFGIPIFLAILFLIFHLTFANNLFFLKGVLNGSESFENTMFSGLFWTADGINSPGVILQNFVVSITDWLSSLVRGWLAPTSEWVSGLLVDGVLAGLFAVISFLPQILLLFLLFSILEDSGYMARVAFILDRLFRKFGLSGRAFMPMIMGFGCSIPAMVNTRTLADDNERTATIRVIPFFSCGAKLPILTAIAGAIALQFGAANPDLITLGMYLLGMVVAIFSVLLMRNTTMKGEVPPFIMELPSYHFPQFKSLMIHLWDKLKHFIKKAFTIILASTIVIWFVLHFSWDWHYLAEEIDSSIITSLGKFIQPVFTPLGFGSQLSGNWGWVFIVAAVTGLIAKENVIGTFSVLAAVILSSTGITYEGSEAVKIMITETGIGLPGLISFIAFNMLTIPCFAAVATAKAELPKGKFGMTIVFWLSISYLVSSSIYLIGTWWWTVFIFIIALAILVLAITLYNKKHAPLGGRRT